MNVQITPKTVVKVLITAVVLVGVYLWWQWADLFASGLITSAHQSFFVVAPLFFILSEGGLAGLFLLLASKKSVAREPNSWDYDTTEKYQGALASHWAKAARQKKMSKIYKIVGFALVAATLVTIGFTIKFWVTHSYKVDQHYVGAIAVKEVPETSIPSFDRRTPYPVAKASSESNLEDVTGDAQGVKYVVSDQEATWNALVHRRTRWYEGSYEVIQEQHLGLTGPSADPALCEFDVEQADRRLGGSFAHSLERLIAHDARGSFYDEDDVYGYCGGDNNDHPMVIVPLKKVEGWWHAYEVPAGIAVYDGLTGDLTVDENVEAGEYEGPVYPISLAERTREAAVSLGTWSERKRTGYDMPSGGNNSEFALRMEDGTGAYVTPLTPRGSSNAIVAEGVVVSDIVTAGQLNTLEVYKLPDTRKSNATVESNIKADYGDLPEGWKGDGGQLRIFEITPVTPTSWEASLGNDKNILYRALINADGTSCIEYANGTKLRCGKATGTGTNSIGNALQQEGEQTGTPVAIPASNKALENLPAEELVELQAAVTREVLRRVEAGDLSTGSGKTN